MKYSNRALGMAVWSLFAFPFPGRGADIPLAQKAHDILQAHCARCHGPDSPAKGGMNFILDRERLVVRNKLVPKDAAQSMVFQRIVEGEMPPPGSKGRPNPEEIAVLKNWIEAGAPAMGPAPISRALITEADVVYISLADLHKIEARQRRFIRYLTFCNLVNAGVPEISLTTYRHGLSKLINSLSWHPRITVPLAIDPARCIYRIDLRDYQWNATIWNRIISLYPYAVGNKSAEFKALARATATDLPFVRADWFVATASRPPLYHDILQMPVTDRDLERQLRVECLQEIQEERVARSGFNGSGVSRNNRLLERHDASYGAYWRSYDFAENIERQNLFEHPLGPQAGGTSFEHSGGEIIFNLPNGLQAYMLVDAKGRRLDRAPIDIVSDPKRPDKIVETAISCFSCHYQGVIPKADQIRAHVEKNPNVFSKEDTAIVKALYPPEASFKALVEEDAERFRKALAKTGASAGEPEPVATFTLRYEGEVDMAAAAGEAGLQPEEFLKRLGATPAMGRALGALKVQGGTVQRQVFQALFGDLVREFHLGDGLATVSNPRNLLNSFPALRPFEGHTGHILAIAFAPAGNQAISGSEDNTVRLWDLTGGREIRCCEGHTGEVLAVAFSTDGKRALSGSMDRTVRLWDLTSGRELRRFEGPTERISSVAFSPDGKRALSGSWDQTLSLWNLETGKELMRLGGHAGYISTVAFSPDGRQALSGSYDRTVRLWDLTSGKPVRVFDGSDKEIYAVAFSPDGKRILSGGNDNLVRLWNAETGQEIRNWVGPAKAIIRVAFSPDGKRVLAGSSQYQGTDTIIRVWDGETGLNLGSFGGKNDTAWSIAFATDGWRALSANIDKTLRLWDLSK